MRQGLDEWANGRSRGRRGISREGKKAGRPELCTRIAEERGEVNNEWHHRASDAFLYDILDLDDIAGADSCLFVCLFACVG